MLGLLAWLVLLAATAVLASLAFGFEVTRIPGAFQALSPNQQIATILAALMLLALIASRLWQSFRLAREQWQARAAREGMAATKEAAALAAAAQKDFDAAVSHLATSDPEEALSAIHKQLSESEKRLARQRGRNAGADMKERLDEVRRRQQALREQIGEVAEKRRAIEPVFEELKDRQRQLARSLDKIESDGSDSNFVDLVKEFELKTGPIYARQQALADAFATLSRLKEGIAKSQAELVQLQAPTSGVKTLLGEVESARDQLVRAIEALETTAEGEAITARAATLDASKKDAELRIARLEAAFAVLDTIRRDMAEFKKRQEDLAAAFAEVETDPQGKSLQERLNELDQFSAQVRGRLRTLQEISTTLNRYRKDLIHSQNELSPLRAAGEGIPALIEELDRRQAELAAALDEVETSGNQTLGARVSSLADARRMAEQRIAEVQRHFAQLETIRGEIATAFADLNSVFKKFV
jgi:chromosome segregation ATPase